MDMLARMETGCFKVFKELNDWFEEFRLYHRKDGKVVKEGDDLMAATRYAHDAALCIHKNSLRQFSQADRISASDIRLMLHPKCGTSQRTNDIAAASATAVT